MLGHYNSEPNFSFKNLEPINYLKTFNRMVDSSDRNSKFKNQTKPKIMSLSKFPLPSFYSKMEGIFQNVSKKRVEEVGHKQEEIEEQRFLKNHNNFMRSVLTKFINDNDDHIQSKKKEKQIICRKSSPHFSKLKNDFGSKMSNYKRKSKETNLDRQYSRQAKATKGTQPEPQKKQKQEKKLNVFPELAIYKNKGKYSIRKEEELAKVVSKRLSLNPEPENDEHNSKMIYQPERREDKSQYVGEIVNLQKKQAKKQEQFSKKIQNQINNIEQKMKIQVHAINYYSFW